MNTDIHLNEIDVGDLELDDQTFTFQLVIGRIDPLPTGWSFITNDTTGSKVKIGILEGSQVEADAADFDQNEQVVVTDVTYKGENDGYLFTATEDTSIRRPDKSSEDSTTETDRASEQEPGPSSGSQSTQATLEDNNEPAVDPRPDDEESEEETDESPVSAIDVGSRQKIEDAIDDAHTDEKPLSEELGPALTTVPFKNAIEAIDGHLYQIQPDERIDSTDEKRRLTYSVLRYLRQQLDQQSVFLATYTGLQFASFDRIPEIDVSDVDGVQSYQYETSETFRPENDFERKVIKGFLEDATRQRARYAGYRANSLRYILSGQPIDLDIDFSDFQIFDRFECSIDITPSGHLYLHINPRTRIRSNFTLDRLDDHEIHRGLRVTSVHTGTGYYVTSKGPEKVMDGIVNNKSIPQYFRDDAPETYDVSEPTLQRIQKENKEVVWATRQGSSTSTESAHAREFLALQGHTENLEEYDNRFWEAARSEMYRSAATRVTDAHEFATDMESVTLGEENLQLDTRTQLFTGDQFHRFVQLYKPTDSILEFANGVKDNHPKKISEHSPYDLPSQFTVLYLYPENLEKENRQGRKRCEVYWDNIQEQLNQIGAVPDERENLSYPSDPDESPRRVATRLSNRIEPGKYDAALVVVPERNSSYAMDPYDDLKQVLGRLPLTSQMVTASHIRGGGRTLRNAAIGLVAAGKGIPFTVEDEMPGDSELFLGLDTGQGFNDLDDDDNMDGVRIGASTTVVLSDGTLLGHTNTGPQTGERIPSQRLVEIVEDSIYGAEEHLGRLPEKITLHRDGFMNEPIEPVENLLEDLGIELDTVEVRKRAPARFVSVEPTGQDDVGMVSAPDKGVACLCEHVPKAYLGTYGPSEPALGENETPRPITIERKTGDTDIETLARQVYLLTQCHVGSATSTLRMPITTYYADKAAEAAANGFLPQTNGLERGIGFL